MQVNLKGTSTNRPNKFLGCEVNDDIAQLHARSVSGDLGHVIIVFERLIQRLNLIHSCMAVNRYLPKRKEPFLEVIGIFWCPAVLKKMCEDHTDPLNVVSRLQDDFNL